MPNLQAKMQLKTTASTLEGIIWPRSLAGWLVIILLALSTLLLLSEAYKFSINYYKIYKWENAYGNLINLELSEDKKRVRLSYLYKIDGTEFLGNKISVYKTEWCDATDREIYRFNDIIKNSKKIIIKYNPYNKIDSVYAFDSGDMKIILFVIFPPLSFVLSFLLVVFMKIRSYINSGCQ